MLRHEPNHQPQECHFICWMKILHAQTFPVSIIDALWLVFLKKTTTKTKKQKGQGIFCPVSLGFFSETFANEALVSLRLASFMLHGLNMQCCRMASTLSLTDVYIKA